MWLPKTPQEQAEDEYHRAIADEHYQRGVEHERERVLAEVEALAVRFAKVAAGHDQEDDIGYQIAATARWASDEIAALAAKLRNAGKEPEGEA